MPTSSAKMLLIPILTCFWKTISPAWQVTFPCRNRICSPSTRVHPRAYGSFIKPIADFALKRHLITIEEAIHKQTGLTASVWKLPNKGLIRDGFDADFILFDETKLRDCADFKDGTQIAEGIVSVYIGGELVYDGKNITEARPGKCLL